MAEPCDRCDGDGYLDIPDEETGGVLGPRLCPDCDGTGNATCKCDRMRSDHPGVYTVGCPIHDHDALPDPVPED